MEVIILLLLLVGGANTTNAQIVAPQGIDVGAAKANFVCRSDTSCSKVTASQFSVGGSTLVVDSGRVGIGVTPLDPFVVRLGTNRRIAFYDASGPSIAYLNDTESSFVSGSILSSDLKINPNNTGSFSVGTSTLVVTGGKVGVGTASPATLFQVSGTAGGSSIAATISNTAVTSNSLAKLSLTDGSTEWGAVNVNTQNGLFSIGNPQNYPLMFYTNGISNARMTISNAGFVGIGTTAPTALLTVQAPTTATDYIVKVSSNNTDTIFYARQNGHVGVGGGIPTLGTCLNATISALSNDNAGTINFTGANSSCAIVWNIVRTNTPVCVVSAAAANATEGAILSAQSASGFSIVPNTGAWDNGDAVNYICLGVK